MSAGEALPAHIGETWRARFKSDILDGVGSTEMLHIFLSHAPGDIVYVSREQKVFLVFGATPTPGSIGGTNNRRFVFDNDNMTLTEAVGKAGGLLSDRADPQAVFVFRMEPRAALASMGVDVSSYSGPLVPTIYNVDWSRSDGFFLANDFYIRNKDVIFVSEHPTTDLLKFLTILRGFTGPGSDLGSAAAIAR